MTTLRVSLASLILATTTLASATEPAEQQSSATTIGVSTRTLLELQRSGKQAGPELPMLGTASVLSYQRYLESHKHPIPATFSSVVGGGAGSGQSK